MAKQDDAFPGKGEIETSVVHDGEKRPLVEGAVTLPIFQSSTFEYAGEENYDDLRYIRLNNTPNHLALGRKIASLEKAEAGMVMSSGMAAISTALMTVLSPGDHLLALAGLYGGTHDLLSNYLSRFGIDHDWVDGRDVSEWERKLRPETKAFYVESITNPLMQVPDLPGVVGFAADNQLLSLIDNTFATPVNFRPLELGFDLVLHSATKYLNGHSDIVGGAVAGSGRMIKNITSNLNLLGGSMDPHTCFLLHRGMKTLLVRVRHQNTSAAKIAEFLDQHSSVKRVYYPGLVGCCGHSTAKSLFGGYGGMLSFELSGGEEDTNRFMERLHLPILAPSLGGVESLVVCPAKTTHAGLSTREREAIGISETLIRFSVGIESTSDLIFDLEQALA